MKKTELTKAQQFILLDFLHNEASRLTRDQEIYKANKSKFKEISEIIEAIHKTWRS